MQGYFIELIVPGLVKYSLTPNAATTAMFIAFVYFMHFALKANVKYKANLSN